MNYILSEIFNFPELEKLCQSFTRLNGIVTAIVDLDGNVHVATGWQPICTQFHRKNNITKKRCHESDTVLAGQLSRGQKYNIYKCKNGLIDIAMPIIVEGCHIGNFFTGQFLTEEPDVNYFRKQAQTFGFNESDYLSALSKVPIFSEKQIKKITEFLVQLTETIGNIGVTNLQNIRLIDKLNIEKAEIIASEEKYRQLAENSIAIIYRISLMPDFKFDYVSHSVTTITGYTPEDHYNNPNLGYELVHPDDLHLLNETTKKTNGEPVVLRWVCKNGKTIWTEQRNLLVFDKQGNPIAIEGSARDITEQKETEIKLRESEEKHRFLFENTIQGVVYHNNIGEIIYANKAAERILGLTLDQMHGRKSVDLRWKSIHEDGSVFPGETHPAMISLKTGKIVKDVKMGVFNPQNNSYTWININSIPKYKASEKKPFEIIVTFEDITLIKQRNKELIQAKDKIEEIAKNLQIKNKEYEALNEELKQSNEELLSAKDDIEANIKLLAKIAENYPNSFVSIIEKDLTVGFSGGQEFKRLNLNPDDFIGLTLNQIFGEHAPIVKNYYLKTFKGEETSFELYINNQYQFYKTVPLLDEYKKISRILVVVENITERKLAEKEIIKAKTKTEASEKRLLYAQHLAELGFWDWNVETGDLYWSDYTFIHYGFKPQEFKPNFEIFSKIVHPNDLPYVLENVNNALKNNIEYSIKFRFNRPNGEIRHLYTKGEVTKDKEGRAIRFIGSQIDITDMVLSEQELIKAKEKAEESDRLKTEFINNMSHEIRTPMNGILGFSKLLGKKDKSEEKRNNYINIIQNSGNQLMRIIDDILEISKLGTKQVKISEKEICLNDLLLEQFSIFDIKAKENKIPLYLKKGLTDIESTILTDETKLNKIISNLLENALKYTNTGFVEFGYLLKNNDLEIYVKDTGIGIKPESQEIIFERFSQEEKELSKNVGGLGLGLSIAKENAELLGGKITLQSEKGKGSIFFVTIPYKPVNKELLKDNNNGIIVKQDKYTILIVEDEEVNYLFIETLLEDVIGINCNILHAKHGQEAVDICQENQEIDFVLMDMKMPIMNGFEATKLIKEFRPDLPIVAQTAYTTTEDKEKALSTGCDDFISKPISEETLNEILNKYLIVKD